MAEPTPTEVAPWYLRNITQALAFAASSNGSNTDILYKFGWEELSN